MYFAHKCKDMSVTLTLYSLASVCPPHLRLHGGPSASPCLMLFTGEQRIFLQESPGPQLSCTGGGQCCLCSSSGAALFQTTSIQHLTKPGMLHRSQYHQHLERMLKMQEEGSSTRQVKVATSCKLFVSYHQNLWRIIAQRNYKDSYNCPCKLIIGFLDWDKFAAEPLEKLKSAMSFKIARTRTANYI